MDTAAILREYETELTPRCDHTGCHEPADFIAVAPHAPKHRMSAVVFVCSGCLRAMTTQPYPMRCLHPRCRHVFRELSDLIQRVNPL